MRLIRRALLFILLLALGALAVVLYYVARPNIPVFDEPQQVHYLDQWDEQARQTYYYTPQGTTVKGLRYDWFTALELPFSRDKFASPDYLARFGFLTDPRQQASELNPGNLPVGFARHPDDETGIHYLDITCAACHTGELRYKGQAVRIDGGAALHSLASTVPTLKGGGFGQALGMSMAFTYYNPIKFERFARSVLGEHDDAARRQLRADFKAVLDRLLGTAYNDWHRGLYPTEEGFGRTDAFGRIANGVFGDAIDPSNYRVANAPVSYPQLWDIWKFDWVQWNGSAMQPMARNIGEALGVGATLHLFGENGGQLPENERYPSSVRLHDLYTLEETLKHLKPPTWPEAILGKVDLALASQGRALFAENCAYCHAPNPVPPDRRLAPERDPEWHMRIVPTRIIGTDPTTADNIADHRFDIRRLSWRKDELARLDVKLFGSSLEQVDFASISSAKGLAYVTAYVENRAYRDAGIEQPERGRMDGYDLAIGVQEIRGYKARPLDGIWATPPFLHNGSVPNLFQLLSPVVERDTRFWVGNFEYDPQRAGFLTGEFKGGFLFDTRVTGNGNRGHEFRDGCRNEGVIGRYLEPQERYALIEYLKVMGDERLESRLVPVESRPWAPGPNCQSY
ncbi:MULTISPECIES: di-heme-cytochrome C peroxidase [unclassified Pseudomonas]|uniref:di-heme-cytochrome C peroxidase n=1 Tax=unclassified Pseudomonas TaxID=196821 RepID=UPI00244B9BF3|nr:MULTISPECIES: di-heme-cytochrome C peroxidase [unclassified Pseudomonas]MDG9929636.1 cytochrome c [Pseudomonas sp. GD04042]MDH0483411.1 cytochrome c [Pseudomonas sp. GD04015]MDH0604786.1 cytochrome c [Pseudomonas sp. GD03869]